MDTLIVPLTVFDFDLNIVVIAKELIPTVMMVGCYL